MKKPEAIFWSIEVTLIVIILSQELNSMCLKKIIPDTHCDMLTWPGEHILLWMCGWRAEKTIIGTLMRIDVYRSHGPDSRCKTLNERLFEGFLSSGRRLSQIQATGGSG